MRAWVILVILFWSNGSLAQLTPDQIDQLKQGVDGTGSLAFQRLTSSGKFLGCTVDFGVTVRDWRAKRGELVKYFGSVTSFYIKGKAFSIVLKVKAMDLLVSSTGNLRSRDFDPADVSLTTGNLTYTSENALMKRRCEAGGLCLSWTLLEPNAIGEFVDSLMSNKLQINVASAPDGMDTPIDFGRIKPENEAMREFSKLSSCYLEFLDHLTRQD